MDRPPVRLIVLFGGQSAEHEVSCVSAYHVLRAIDPARYDIEAIGITRDGTWIRAEDAVAELTAPGRHLPDAAPDRPEPVRSEARRVGIAWVRWCRIRGGPEH